ncbi:MAG: hypothetical protein PHR83_13995 [Paludibacter sp.]|nr:hypothetical protein [Paludibacter sp.]
MPSNPRMPRTFTGMYNYLFKTEAHLLAGDPDPVWKNLGITEEEMTQWSAFKAEYSDLYFQYSDDTNTRTKAIRDKMQNALDRVVEFDQRARFLDRIAASREVTIDDLKIFNIKKGPLQKSIKTTRIMSISENVTVTMQPLGGGMVGVKCYSMSGQRAHIIDDADCVQYAYMVGLTPPAAVTDEGIIFGLSSRASFNLSLGANQARNNLYIFFRWFNTRHPKLAGPWGPLQNSVII